MATIAELQDALVNADKAGDTQAAQKLADAIVAMKSAQDQKPAAVQAGETIGGIPRQLGLTARYAMEGPAQFGEIFTEPIRYGLSKAGVNVPSLSSGASSFANAIGLPKPDGANERVIGDMARMGFGAMAGGGLGKMAGGAAEELLSKSLGQNVLSAVGAGGAGGAVREAGGGPWSQAAAALFGGVTAPMAANAVSSTGATAGRWLRDLVAPARAPSQQVDQKITLLLKQHGVDWQSIPEAVKQRLRGEVSKALDTGGDLDPAAVRRLLDANTVDGFQPTRGMLTQDPVQITREKNLAKTGANSTDMGLQKLPRLENTNTQALLRKLDDLGAKNAPDDFATGKAMVSAMDRLINRSKGKIDALYGAARDTSGRSAQLDGAAFTTKANQMLDQEMVGGALPADVANTMNKIARGEMPFTVEIAEQLKTRIGKLQRASSDGSARMALGVVRQALDDTPLRQAPQVNPGNLPAVPGTVPPSPAVVGQESIEAFNRARSANRAFMERLEKTPALKAVYEGVEPDRFVKQFITGQGSTAKDVEMLRRAIGGNKEALDAVRGNLVSHLKSAATNGTEDVVKFSPAGYNSALNRIGDQKLAAFFSPEEIRQLRAVGKVGTMMTAQPAGTAVNNSNSGALVVARALDALDSIVGKMPLGVNTMIQGTMQGIQQGNALNVPKSLLMPVQPVPFGQRVGVPAVYGGLFAAQPTD